MRCCSLVFQEAHMKQSWVFSRECPSDQCPSRGKDSGLGRGRSWAGMQAWQLQTDSPKLWCWNGQSELSCIGPPTSISHGCGPPLESHDLGLAALCSWGSLEGTKDGKPAVTNTPKSWTISLWGGSGWSTFMSTTHSYKVGETESKPRFHLKPKCLLCPPSHTLWHAIHELLRRTAKVMNPESGRQELTSPGESKFDVHHSQRGHAVIIAAKMDRKYVPSLSLPRSLHSTNIMRML